MVILWGAENVQVAYFKQLSTIDVFLLEIKYSCEVERQLVFVAFNSQECLHILRCHQNGNLI